VSDEGGRIVEQLSACLGDALQQFGLFATEQTGSHPAKIGAEPSDALNPLAREAEIESVKFVRLSRPRLRATIDFGQQPFTSLVKPGGSGSGVNQVRLAPHGGIIASFIRGREAAKPVAIDIHIIVEEGHDLMTRLGDRPIPGVTKPLARLVNVTQETLERRDELRDNLGRLVGTVVIDDEDLMGGRVCRVNLA
jgi:hypothetical protein